MDESTSHLTGGGVAADLRDVLIEDRVAGRTGTAPRLAPTSGPAVLMSEPPELDDPGLVRVHLQRERLQPLLQLGQEPVRIGKVLEAHHHVVGVPQIGRAHV